MVAELTKFVLYASSDNEDTESKSECVGYKKIEEGKTILYFKDNNKYKFVIDKELEVMVNDSYYKFELNKETQGKIVGDSSHILVSIYTSKLLVDEHKIELEYTIDFKSFKTKHKIILELL